MHDKINEAFSNVNDSGKLSNKENNRDVYEHSQVIITRGSQTKNNCTEENQSRIKS